VVSFPLSFTSHTLATYSSRSSDGEPPHLSYVTVSQGGGLGKQSTGQVTYCKRAAHLPFPGASLNEDQKEEKEEEKLRKRENG
jgi:hypothetical protein